MDKTKISVILSEGWVGPRGAKDLRNDRGSAPRFVRRSFAPTPAPTLSLRMTGGWFWALDNERRNTASPHKHWNFLGSEGWVGPRGAKDLCADRGSAPGFVRRSFAPTPAPTLSLRMTGGWFWALDNEPRSTANRYKHDVFLEGAS